MEELYVYHASLSSIQKFDYSDGVHFGGRISSLQAVHRKLGFGEYAFVYIYTCSLLVDKFYDSEDVGCKEEWDKVIVKAKAEGYKVIRYRNKYEPDSYPSYLVLESSILTVLGKNCIHSSDLEDELDAIFIV